MSEISGSANSELTKLGKYNIKRELGRGAMGVVYEGFDPYILRTVAIKTIHKSLIDHTGDREILDRFRREAQAAGRLTHPNIVAVYEYGEDGDIAFIAMEYINGIELKDFFDKGKKFQPGEGADFMLQMLDALEFSHNRGVIHRDIKPANIMIADNGQIKIADFGIAKIESSELTQVGTVLGTPSYMSPEQFLGEAVDKRSDLYSAGVILYQFLTGVRPFGGSNMSIIMHKVMNELPASPRTLDDSVPEALSEVAMKALSKKPEHRFQSAAEFQAALKSAAKQAVSQPDTSGSYEPTIKIFKPSEIQPKSDVGQDSAINFNMSDFEQRLADSLSEANRSGRASRPSQNESGADQPDESLHSDTPSLSSIVLSFEVPAQVKEVTTQKAEAKKTVIDNAAFNDTGSNLLASLASEANEKLDAKQAAIQDNRARNQRVHDALDRIVKFLTPFIKHVNNVEPVISRSYRLDARTTYANLKWKAALVDYRKLSLSDAALLDYITFSVNLCAPEPVPLKRPWGQIEALKKELHHLRLRTEDDLEAIIKKPQQEWLQANLAPDFPLQIKFQGNYDKGSIDVMGRNIENFGMAAFKLEPADVTPAFLDDFGLFLLGRKDKLPTSLRRV